MCPQDYLSPQHGKGRTWCQPHWVSMNMSWCWSRMIGGKENGQLYSSSIKHHASPWAIITLFFKNFYFYCYSITIVCIFSPFLHPTPANPTSLPHLYLPPWFCPCVLYCSSCKPLSPLSPPHSPLAIVTLFLISMSLVIFCMLFSFVDHVPIKGEIIWYLSLTTWLISLSIMLSSSIYAVAKGVSSFFLSAA